jgi:hypothetical protein
MIDRSSALRSVGALCAAVFAWPAVSGAAPNLEGVWSGVFTTQDNEYWNVEDYACFSGCMPEAYAYLQKLLDDPANDSTPFEALMGRSYGYAHELAAKKFTDKGRELQASMREDKDPAFECTPYAFAREVRNALPIRISHAGANLKIDYEEWQESRMIYLDGRGHPKTLKPTPLGHSIGHYEGDDLIVETVGVTADLFFPFEGGGGYSEQTRGRERYTVAENPRRLVLELTLEDPVMLAESMVITKTWLYTPDVKLVKDTCKDYPARP